MPSVNRWLLRHSALVPRHDGAESLSDVGVIESKRDRLLLEGMRDSWQEERECGALAWRTFHGNGPSVFLNDPEDHCEAQAGPFPTFFGRDKGLKDFREDIGRNPAAGIRDS